MTRSGRSAAWVLGLVLACGSSAARADFVLYDGNLGTTPNAQGWLYLTNPLVTQATQSAGGGVTTLDTTARTTDQAGYFGNAHPLIGTLDRNVGFTVTIRLRLESESHDDVNRAGFSLIALGSDSKGLELAFWRNEVWAQGLSGTQFVHAEGATFDTTASLTDYALSFQGNTYSVSAGGQTILSGQVRDYTPSGNPVYSQTSFLFLGDDTSSAAARTQIARVTLSAVPEPSSLVLGAVGAVIMGFALRRGNE